jgi:SAM-dependent methyltransferase
VGALDAVRKARDLLMRLVQPAPLVPAEPQARSIDVFDTPSYSDITRARLRHLDSLDLPLAGHSVLDLGAGVGHFAEFFRSKGCRVHCVDARPDNVARLRTLYPDVRATVLDIETGDLSALGRFDVVCCYGLIYHLVDPIAALQKIAAVCDRMLLLETCVVDAAAPVVFLVPEDSQNPSQALGGWGCRPSPGFLRAALRHSGYQYLYQPRQVPDHEEFRYKPLNNYSHLRDGRLMRAVVVAARDPIAAASLMPWVE